MVTKKIAPYLYIGKDSVENNDILAKAEYYNNAGADELVIFDCSVGDEAHEASLLLIKKIAETIDIPILGGGHIDRLEDVKKLIYAGCRSVFLDFEKEHNIALLEEASKRFGQEKITVLIDSSVKITAHKKEIEDYASEILLPADEISVSEVTKMITIPVKPLVMRADMKGVLNLLGMKQVSGVCGKVLSQTDTDFMEVKHQARELGIPVNTFESSMSWPEFKLGGDGLIPVIVQDYKTQEVLMLAYMNREAFEMTIKTGKMTYYSRSRSELWLKGETSGHYQYVKALSIDCDNDTILAKVVQIGAACHTGNRRCFYRDLVKKDYDETNPLKVFEDVFAVIKDRKEHPKEGSYTNYLFDKGIDKILKKVGEEATEIVIAAKNPGADEIKYEISDFLYHIMVLMAEKNVSWEDIVKELARR